MDIKLSSGWWYRAVLIVVVLWILHDFAQALLAACVAAVASWPLYRRFALRCKPRIGSRATALVFTVAMTVFVLAPMIFAFGALLTEAQILLVQIAAADKSGITAPAWLHDVPIVGAWVAARWQHELAHPGALLMWTQRMDATAVLAWAQSLGQFMARHVFIILFTALLLYFLYQDGDELAADLRRVLRDALGERAEAYLHVAARAARASVNSMLVVGLFDGLACGAAYAIAQVPHAALWAAITGTLAIVPFLGYAAVAALTLQLAITGAAQGAVLSLVLGCLILLCGDKVVRPLIAGNGVRLPFVWVLIGCLGGFETLGIVGLVVGPVALALTREMWKQQVREIRACDVAHRCSPKSDARAMVR